jgi:translation initiation factor 6
MAILKSQVFGSPLIGVYLEINTQFALYPSNLLKSSLSSFREIFKKTSFHKLTINNSNLVGVYTASNRYGIIFPDILREGEREDLESYLENEDDSYEIGIVKSIDNAFGNLILCNDQGAIISSLLRKHKDEIENTLNVETVVFDFANSYLPGSIGLANNKGCLVHPLSSDDEIDFISSILKVETDVSTINRGIPYLSSSAAVNDEGGIFGKYSTGPEMMRLTNVLKL